LESQQNAYPNIRQWRMPVKKLFAECHSRIKSGLFLRDLWFKSGHLKKELSASLKTIWYQKLLGFAKHAQSEIHFNGFTDLLYRACKQEQLPEILSPIYSRCCYSCSCLQAIKYCFIVQSTFKKFLTDNFFSTLGHLRININIMNSFPAMHSFTSIDFSS